jgi:hypothetical protein
MLAVSRPHETRLVRSDDGLVAWEEGGTKGPAPRSLHGGAVHVPPHSAVYYTYAFERGVQYASVDGANEVEKRFRAG